MKDGFLKSTLEAVGGLAFAAVSIIGLGLICKGAVALFKFGWRVIP